MATLKLILYTYSKLKTGGYKIKVSMSHRQETCYFNTRFVLDNPKQWSNGAVVKRDDASIINSKLRGLLDRYQEALDSINNHGLYTAKQLKVLIEKKLSAEGSRTFHDVAIEYIDELNKEGRTNYSSMLDLCMRYFDKFSGKGLFMQDITPNTIAMFQSWLKTNTEANETTITKYMSHSKVIINRAIKMQYVSYDVHPFYLTKLSRSVSREEDISLESLLAIKNIELKSKHLIVSRDLFMLSFYLGGVNLVDIMDADFSKGDEMSYIRTKTKRHNKSKIVVPIVPQAKEIIDRWIDTKTGKLNFGYNYSYRNFLRYIGRGISALKENLGIKETLVFYSARNTFSQFAADLGIPNAVIDYCLGHSVGSQGVISYYIKVKKQQAAIAINRVVDYVNNPKDYEEFLKLRKDIMIAKV